MVIGGRGSNTVDNRVMSYMDGPFSIISYNIRFLFGNIHHQPGLMVYISEGYFEMKKRIFWKSTCE